MKDGFFDTHMSYAGAGSAYIEDLGAIRQVRLLPIAHTDAEFKAVQKILTELYRVVFWRRAALWERCLLFVAGIGLFWPNLVVNVAGVLIGLLPAILNRRLAFTKKVQEGAIESNLEVED